MIDLTLVLIMGLMFGSGFIRFLEPVNRIEKRLVNLDKFSTFKTNIEKKITNLLEELKRTKFNREECLQYFPGYFHFESAADYEREKNKSRLFKITEKVDVFPEFSVVFLIV